MGEGGENRGKKRGEHSRECAHTSSSSSSSCFFYSSSGPVTNGRQLKLGRPRAFKRRRFRSHVRNESSGTRIDASVAQKDVDDEARRAAAARSAERTARRDLRPSEHSRSPKRFCRVFRATRSRAHGGSRRSWGRAFLFRRATPRTM